ncbi:MAG: hypothetical protein EXS49_00165 [Candidatus Pacebacteria bacterium]|nr:hypothetical protein [Candidatus Paceibacterota bacterium]
MSIENPELKPEQLVVKKTLEYGDDWESRKDAIIEKLDKKAEIIAEFKKLTDSISLETPHEEVRLKLRDYLKNIKTSFSEEMGFMLDKYNLLYLKFKEISYELESSDTDLSNERILENEIVCGEMIDIEKNDDVYFLIELERIIEDLIVKNKFIKENQDKEGFFLEDIKTRKEEGEMLTGEEFSRGPFDIVFLTDDEIAINKRYCGGYHIGNTPYSVVKNNENIKRRDITIEHEKIHNLLDGVFSMSTSNINHIKNRIERYKRLVNLNAPKNIIDNEKGLIMGTSFKEIIDDSHNEIMATVKNTYSEYFDMWTQEALSMAIFNNSSRNAKFSTNLDFNFENASNNLSTAGKDAGRFVEFLENEIKGEKDDDLLDFYKKLLKDFKDVFVNIYKNIILNMKYAKRLENDDYLKTYSLFAILKPYQYRHIATYIESKQNKEKK